MSGRSRPWEAHRKPIGSPYEAVPFQSKKHVFSAFRWLQKGRLRRSDGASSTRSNSISFDETSTSSARAVYQKRLELHTQWFRRSEASSREHAKAECTIFIERNAPRRSNHCICSVWGCRDAQSTIFVERKQLAVRVAETTIFVVFGSFWALKPLRV